LEVEDCAVQQSCITATAIFASALPFSGGFPSVGWVLAGASALK